MCAHERRESFVFHGRATLFWVREPSSPPPRGGERLTGMDKKPPSPARIGLRHLTAWKRGANGSTERAMSLARAVPVVLALLASACGNAYEPGVEVRVVSAPSGLAREEVLDSVPAQQVRVFELYWTSVELELLPCASFTSRVWEALVPSAHAHGVSSPERLAVPVVGRATDEGPRELGVLRPPATDYCGVRYRIGAADADAVGLDQVPDMAGHSLGAHGEVDQGSRTAQPFSITSTRSFEVVLPIELKLSSRERRATITIGHAKESWFRGLAFHEAGDRAREAALIQNFQDSITIHVE